MKMVLRKMFAVENQRYESGEKVSFKINEKKFGNLIREMKEENIKKASTTAEENYESDLDPSFQLGLKWFNRIN